MKELNLGPVVYGMKGHLDVRRHVDDALAVAAAGGVADLAALADEITPVEGVGTPAWALAGAVRALDRAQRWEPAVAAAEVQPERFRDAAKHLARNVLAVSHVGRWGDQLVDALEVLADLSSFDQAKRAADLLRRVAFATPVTTLFERPPRYALRRPEPGPGQPPVAHLRFDLDDQPAAWPIALRSGNGYRLGATLSVEAWPPDVDRLEIVLEGAPPALIDVGAISIPRDRLTGETWLFAKAEIGINSSVELRPAAKFIGAGGEQPVRVVGQRMLRVSTFDPTRLGTGQPMVGQQILKMIEELERRIPALPRQDRDDVIVLLEATANFASLASERDDLEDIDELEFQRKLKQAFVQDPRIGRSIQEGSRLAGGIVDLVLRRVNDELKVRRDPTDIANAADLVGQPAQYASGAGSPISILTVLDQSPKTAPPAEPSNYMTWVRPQVHGVAAPGVPSMVAVVIIPVGFRIPSRWTKTPLEKD